MADIKQIAVIGAGQMGNGIAEVSLSAGYSVYLMDQSKDMLDRGVAKIEHNWNKLISKGRITEQEKSTKLANLITTTTLEAVCDVDLVIEAVVESKQIKEELFARLDALAPSATILASNTSSLPITALAAVTNRADRVIGMHFMNPVPVMKLVEVIRGLGTSDETYQTVLEVSKKLGKKSVEVNDFPGFISNRILMPMINEAIYAVYEGVANAEAIDDVMKLGMNHPMGPLELADFIGLDTCLSIMETLYEGFADSKYRPCPLLKKYVSAGWLGRKSNRGFYDYRSGNRWS
ncbi:3-hydroxybutyryl-CoA dehydrogenase [Shimazuella alba]|uniref:3-hydroxybutyryl-CoA dehydrogenase n=1 Tax=Shimazuella alba TaxID=2690964 RepID=A0A6I4VPL0_9BACL|nr:3-hydroxybutyryl-CoA dehydrogenase [Shimazuella alba]MXQ53003.1 3-hydroxybutyryl-CoA dehydrogenase [Shimazuella alba]